MLFYLFFTIIILLKICFNESINHIFLCKEQLACSIYHQNKQLCQQYCKEYVLDTFQCMKYCYSGVKSWKLTSNFPNRKTFWNVKDKNIPSKKIPCYKHGCDTKAKYGCISHNCVSRESYFVESGILAQIKVNTNILIEFEISRLKNQSSLIN